jgi:hypothetical protein
MKTCSESESVEVETTFDTNNYCRPTLVSWLVRVRNVILFLSVAMCDNDNVVIDEVKLINK